MRFLGPWQRHVLAVFGFLAFAGAGCGGGHSSRNGGTSAATLSLPWAIYDVGDPNMTRPLKCADVRAGGVVVTTTNSATNQTFTDSFNCGSNGGTTDYLPAGTYTVTITLYADPAVYGNNTTVLDEYVWTQTLVAGSNPVSTVALFVNSYVLGWSLASSCGAIGAAYVALDIYYPPQTTPTTYFFNCTSGTEATSAIPVGIYGIQWQAALVDASYRDLTQPTPLAQYTVRNEPSDQTRVQADLGNVYFPY